MPVEHSAIVVEKRSLTPVVRHLVLRLDQPESFAFRPGHIIQFVVEPRTLRLFSLASTPAALPLIDLCVDISPNGKGSRFIEALTLGERVQFRGPFGVFTVPPEETRPLEFVATGAGIAPIRGMIQALYAHADASARPITLTFGNRTVGDILYHEEWRALEARVSAFRYLPTLSQSSAEWTGLRGRVTDVLPVRKAELAGRVFFLCGSPAMVDDTRNVLAQLGVPERDIHFEKFT
ncbi:MAG: Na+-transporting NADH:ubiquinone oxidoreductase subunit F [Parcubacteria group bacterium Gr01-1014_106]|nr:MAG: Na+-transporting NADH:ubiquinone oxidoreductase subunit F [Parcubacteria group bacterium Gr01-1014_106]